MYNFKNESHLRRIFNLSSKQIAKNKIYNVLTNKCSMLMYMYETHDRYGKKLQNMY